MDTIFPSPASPEYGAAKDGLSAAMERLGSLLSRAESCGFEGFGGFDGWLSECLGAVDATLRTFSTLRAYSYAVYSVDTTNAALLSASAEVESLGVAVDELSLRFRAILRDNAGGLDGFFRARPGLSGLRFVLDEEIRATGRQMSAAEESLASELSLTGGGAWERLHEQLVSNLSDGGRTFNELRNDAFSPDPRVRKSSWSRERSLLSANEIAFAACLNAVKGATVALNRRRGWADALERSLFSSRLSRASLDSLILAVRESLPAWRRYFRAKAAWLRRRGLTASDSAGTASDGGLAFYDLFAPVGGSGRAWTFGEAGDFVVSRFRSFSGNMGDFAETAFERGWIDAEIRPGKVGGAYDEDFAMQGESRILANFSGSFGDVVTLAHELGHAYHFSRMKGAHALCLSYPMTLAETASTFAETVVKQSALAESSGAEKLSLLDLDLQDAAQVLVDILSRFIFERRVFDERAGAEMTAADFRRLMAEAQEEAYGDGLSRTERHDLLWAVKSHYYSPDLDFYNFPYAFGQLFGAGLYESAKSAGGGFSERYDALLRRTGSASCEDVCADAGFDITTPDFWRGGIAVYAREIDEFVRLASED